MHQISMHMEDDCECWFTQFFPDTWYEKMVLKLGLMEQTIFSGHFKRAADKYLAEHGLKEDYMAQKNEYDMTLFCTDMIVPRKLRKTKTVWVQEGMIDKLTPWARFVKNSGFIPRYFAMNTSLNGSSDLCDIFCTASEGFKNYLVSMGTNRGKIAVTGIPNFDNVAQYQKNDFPRHGYVMVATSDIRESFSVDDRVAFLKNCVKIANGRQMLFKLHPNEIQERAIGEIKKYAPAGSWIYTTGNANEMVANCEELITQYSTLSFLGLIYGKKVHSYFDVDELRRRIPIQNGGTSAQIIADLCLAYLHYNGESVEFLKQYKPAVSAVAV